jgi:hypothetical protein
LLRRSRPHHLLARLSLRRRHRRRMYRFRRQTRRCRSLHHPVQMRG